jgi:hypothetical protein
VPQARGRCRSEARRRGRRRQRAARFFKNQPGLARRVTRPPPKEPAGFPYSPRLRRRETTFELGDAQPVPWIDRVHDEVAGGDVTEELDLRWRSETGPDQMGCLGDHRNDEGTRVITE